MEKASFKLGALFVKELLNKQYKPNYYQKVRAQSEAFYKWKAKYRQAKQLQRQRESKSKAHSDSIINSNDPSFQNNNKKLTLKNVIRINVELEKQRKQKVLQARMIKLNIALRKLTAPIKQKIYRLKASTFNTLKDSTLDGLSRQEQFDKEFELIKAGDQSEINDESDHENMSMNHDQDVENILSHISPGQKSHQINTEPKMPDSEVKRQFIDDHSPNELIDNRSFSNGNNESENDDSPQNSNNFNSQDSKKLEFNPKMPLSIDIASVESDDEGQNMVIYDSKSKPIDNNLSDTHNESEGDEYDDDMGSKHNPWVNGSEKHRSPFGDYKKRLIITTDSMDSNGIKMMKPSGKFYFSPPNYF